MLRVVISGLLTRKLRAVLTAIAIVLGVAMIVGSLVLTDQIRNAFTEVFVGARATTDVVVTKQASFKANNSIGDSVPFPESNAARVEAVPGVQKAAPAIADIGITAVVMRNGKPKAIRSIGGAPDLGYSVVPPPFDTATIVAGRLPSSNGEVALSKSTADQESVRVGEHLQIASVTGLHPATMVGIFDTKTSTGGASAVLMTLPDAQSWMDKVGKVDEIDVQAAPGVSATELKSRIQQALPDLQVRTGEEQGRYEAAQFNQIVDVLGYALTIFGVIAVFVGAFIIFNTFSITVAQRMRELALLRTLGASRRQVLTSVLGEAAIIGVAASLVGIVVGLGIAKLISVAFEALGFGLPLAGQRLLPSTIAIALAVGVGVTVLAALAPALRATRIPPVAAMREGATLPRGWFGRHLRIIEPVVALVGIGAIIRGLFFATGLWGYSRTVVSLSFLGVGAIVTLVGVALLSSYIVPPIARIAGYPLERIGGVAGRIARENSVRNPTRTAITAAALMIGLTVVVLVSVLAAGLKQQVVDSLGTSIKAQLFVSGGGQNTTSLPGSVVGQIQAVPGVQAVAPLAALPVKVNGGPTTVATSVTPAFADAYKLEWAQGGSGAISGIGRDGAVIVPDLAKRIGATVGSRLELKATNGRSATVVVRGIAKSSPALQGIDLLIAADALRQLDPRDRFDFAFVITKPGADVPKIKSAVEQVATAATPLAQVQSNQDVIDQANAQINQLLGLLYGLLAISVIISLFGIVNTLLLSIFERTREIGLLRAVGASRRQVRRMIRYEAVITSIIGAILGVAVGLLFGAMLVSRLDQIPFVVPWTLLVALFLLAIVAGIFAAILPARRASRLNVLDALHYE